MSTTLIAAGLDELEAAEEDADDADDAELLPAQPVRSSANTSTADSMITSILFFMGNTFLFLREFSWLTSSQVSRLSFSLLRRLPAYAVAFCLLVSFTVTGIAWKSHPLPLLLFAAEFTLNPRSSIFNCRYSLAHCLKE